MSTRRRRLTGIVGLAAGLALAGCSHAPVDPVRDILSSGNRWGVEAEASPTQTFTPPASTSAPLNPVVTNNSAALHVGPADNVAAIKDVIANAKKTLFIEVFNFGNDSMGQQIAPLVIDAARRGVQVKFLADYVGSRFAGADKLAAPMEAAGVDFRYWMPRFIHQDDQHRGINITHRKLYLADGWRGLTGGVNLMAPFDTTTHDILVDFRGEVAEQLPQEFQRDWRLAKGPNLQFDPLPAGVTYGGVSAQTLVTSPPEGRFEAQQAIYQAVEGARSEVLIEQQYLWDDGLMSRLIAASKRGVKVRAIVPGKSDPHFSKGLNTLGLNEILQSGGEAHLYNGVPPTAHVHTKYFAIDDRWACFGSVNGDTRAMMDNQELDVATTDQGLIQQLKTRLFETDWQGSSVIFHFDPSRWESGPFLKFWDILDYYL